MVLTKCKDVTKQGTVKYSEENSLFREVSILGGVEGGSGMGGGGVMVVACLLTFSAFRMGSYSRMALIQGWALI